MYDIYKYTSICACTHYHACIYLCAGIHIEIPRYDKKKIYIHDRTQSHSRHTHPQGASTRPAIHGEGTSVYSIQLGSIISTSKVLSGMDPLITANNCWQTKWVDQCINISQVDPCQITIPPCTMHYCMHTIFSQ